MLQDGLAAIRKAGFNVGSYAALKDSRKTCAELKIIGRVLLDVVYSGKQRALPKPWLTASPAEAPRFGYVTLVKVVAQVLTCPYPAVLLRTYVAKKEMRGKRASLGITSLTIARMTDTYTWVSRSSLRSTGELGQARAESIVPGPAHAGLLNEGLCKPPFFPSGYWSTVVCQEDVLGSCGLPASR